MVRLLYTDFDGKREDIVLYKMVEQITTPILVHF